MYLFDGELQGFFVLFIKGRQHDLVLGGALEGSIEFVILGVETGVDVDDLFGSDLLVMFVMLIAVVFHLLHFYLLLCDKGDRFLGFLFELCFGKLVVEETEDPGALDGIN